jgi:hypothetical protein
VALAQLAFHIHSHFRHPSEGVIGLLYHRGFGDKATLLARCRDTALDGRGFIIPLDDEDLGDLVEARNRAAASLTSLCCERDSMPSSSSWSGEPAHELSAYTYAGT